MHFRGISARKAGQIIAIVSHANLGALGLPPPTGNAPHPPGEGRVRDGRDRP